VYAELRRQGNEASKAGRKAEAIELWTRAYAVRRTHIVACAIGRVELLGRANPSAAALWLTRCLRLAPVPVKGQGKELAAQQEEIVLRDLARSRVGALRIQAEPGAAIFVDGRAVGEAPLEDEVFLEPGSHRLAASLGSRSRSVDVAIAAGEDRAVDLVFQAAPGPLRTAAPTRPPAPGPSRWSTGGVVRVGGGITVGAAVLGGVLAVMSYVALERSEEALREQRAAEGEYGCLSENRSYECIESRKQSATAENLAIASKGSFIAAGATAVATLGVVLLSIEPNAIAVKADARGVRVVGSW
jgi:hypothetical protein